MATLLRERERERDRERQRALTRSDVKMVIYHQRLLQVTVLLLCYTGGTFLTVKSSVGEYAVLPCDVGITTDVANLTVEWFRTDRPGYQHVYFWRGRGEVLDHKDPSYKGRTSLFQDEVRKGNVFLNLTRVKPSDEGNYTCHIDELMKKSTVQLTVAPVVSVSMELEGNTLTCSSRGIYLEPTLTWSTSPSFNYSFYNSTTVTKTTEQLYDISSILTFTSEDSQLDYICSVATEGGGKTVTLSRLSPVHCHNSDDVAIPCKAPSSALKDLSVTWSFNHNETIINYFSTSPCTPDTDKWKEQVRGVSESGALQLSASSVKLEGVYRCELCRADDTYVSYTSLTIIQKNIGHVGVIILFIIIIIIIIALAIMYRKWRARSRDTVGTPSEMQALPSTSAQNI